MTILKLPVADLRTVLPFVADQDIRHYLNGVFVEPLETGCLLVATNGHLMGACYSEEARVDKARILRVTPELTEQLEEEAPDERHTCVACGHENGLGSKWQERVHVVVEDEASHATITGRDTLLEIYVQPGKAFVDGKYPEWRKPFPSPERLVKGFPGLLQSRYLADLQRIPDETYHSNGVELWHFDGYDAAEDRGLSQVCVARFPQLPNLIVAIMPLRYQGDQHVERWPQWMKWRTEKPPPQPSAPPEPPTVDEVPSACATGACEA